MAHMVKINGCRVQMGKPERKRSLGKPKHRWGDNIKMDLKRNRMEGDDS